MSATCKSCGAAIRWVVMPSGKRMPLDAEPHPDGTVQIAGDTVTACVVARADRVPGTEYFLSHFATCAHGAQHRRTQ